MENDQQHGGDGGAGGDADSNSTAIQTVNLRPKNVYGLRADVKGNIHFNLQQEVIYPVEGVLAFHDYVENKQRFLRFAEDTNPLIVQINPSRKMLAILEQSKSTKVISIYELSTLKKRRVLEMPASLSSTTAIQEILFTADSKGLVLLTEPPEETLYLLMLDKTTTTYESRPSQNVRGKALCISTNPQDTSLVAYGGESILMLLTKSEKGFSLANNVKINSTVVSLVFIAMDLLMVGTDADELILIENGEMKLRQKASTAEYVDLLMDQEAFDRAHEVETDDDLLPAKVETSLPDSSVVCLTNFVKGFAYAIFNRVFVFDRISKFRLEKKTVLTIPITIYDESLYQITNLAIDSKLETVIVSTRHSQIYVGILIVPETLKAKQLQFSPLGPLIHIGEIVDIALCSWKPIIMTASKDQTIRIWNYETEKVELVRKFQVDVNVIALHATGLLAAIGFSDQLRITQIFMEELNIVKTYNFPRCRDVKYSNYGHLMAAAYDSTIAITSVYNLELVINLKGHNGTVLSVAWTKNDKYLISGGNEGAIYQWDVENGSRLQEIVQKGTEYISVAVSFNDPLSILAVTNSGLLREFQKSELVREIVMPSSSKCKLTDVVLARSDMVMFVANQVGDLINVQMPFLDAGGGTCTKFRFFVSSVNKLTFSYDGTLLAAVSKGGTLTIWAMENIQGKVAAMDQDLLRSQEVLIPRTILAEKNAQIINLELRLKQQAEEFQYQLTQSEANEGEALAQIHRNYHKAMDELKRINAELEAAHAQEMAEVRVQINNIKEEHKKTLTDLANQYSERMLVEYKKFNNLRDSMLDLRENYESKLKKSAGTLQDTVEALENDYKKQLDERKLLIRDLLKEMQNKKQEFADYCQQVEEETEQKTAETQRNYEQQLKEEQEETQLWRGKAGVLQKKFDALTKDVDNLLEEVELLKEENKKAQNNIAKLNRTIEDLQKDLSDRDFAIGAKEKRIQDLLHKNQELDKYKQVLNHKIAELKAQIEPREFQINDKRKHILEMENELAGLNQNNSQLELQLKELKDKYLSNIAELKVERHRARAARDCVHNLCSEIYHIANLINSPDKLKVAIKDLFQRHASDDELKRFISLDANVRDEFQRQRTQIERVLKIYKNQSDDNEQKRKYDKLFKENLILLEEIGRMKEEFKVLRSHAKREMSFKKPPRKNSSIGSDKSRKSLEIQNSFEKDVFEEQHGAVGGNMESAAGTGSAVETHSAVMF